MSSFVRALAAAFRPPFAWLGLVVWSYFVWCFLMHPQTAILRGDFVDPDDTMYLTHILDWLKGQSWFDTVQHRLTPPDGTPLHFSRLTELPIAAIIWPLKQAGLDWTAAATIAAAFWPLVLFAGMLATLRWVARAFMSSSWAGVTAYVALFASSVLFVFGPGEVTHHGLALLLVALSFGFTVRMLQEPSNVRWGLGAGLSMALGLAIALETLPWILILSASLGIGMMFRGAKAAMSGLVFGQTFYFVSAAILAITTLPSAWFKVNLLSYSVVYVILTGIIAICCAGVALASQTRWAALRYIAGIGLSFSLAALFLSHFPELMAGPYGGMDKSLAKLMFTYIGQAVPLIRGASSVTEFFLQILFPLLGLGAALFFLNQAQNKNVWPWFLTTVLLIATLFLTIYGQYRAINFAMLFSIVPLAAFLHHSLGWAANHWQGRKLFAAELGLILLVGPLPSVLLPALNDSRPFNTGVLLFPVPNDDNKKCQGHAIWDMLALPSYYGDRPRVIMNTTNDGPDILFRTPHSVLAANYHTNVTGNLDAARFFTTTTPDEAKKIAQDHHVDLIVMCGVLSSLYKTPFLSTPSENKKTEPTFAEQLVADQVPDWLKPVKDPLLGDYRVFEMKQTEPSKKL